MLALGFLGDTDFEMVGCIVVFRRDARALDLKFYCSGKWLGERDRVALFPRVFS
jgi:hypothetical protein